jgi:ferredoxin
MLFLKNANVAEFISRLAKSNTVYLPFSQEKGYFLKPLTAEYSQSDGFLFNSVRTALPLLKSLLFPLRCIAVRYSAPFKESKSDGKRQVIFGIKACDLLGKKVLDTVFLKGDYVDGLYKEQCENTVIISGDCTEALPNCFCTMVGVQPHPTVLFDLNMSPVADGYIFESGSPKGEQLIKDNKDLFSEVIQMHLKERNARRSKVSAIVETQNQQYKNVESRQNIVERNLTAPVWYTASQTCVECNGCNYVCPTCYCFLLYDQKEADGFDRVKAWDSCFYAGYARMAGGLTPRLHLVDRFKNHYYHKFDSYVMNYGFEACSGCGRCIETCMGKIDKRQVLKEVEKYVKLL